MGMGNVTDQGAIPRSISTIPLATPVAMMSIPIFQLQCTLIGNLTGGMKGGEAVRVGTEV